MKRQLLFAALLVIGFNASAQFTKGEKVLSGNLSFSTNKTTNTTGSVSQTNSGNNFFLNTGIGWVKSEKRISGFRVGYYNGLLKSNGGLAKSANNSFLVGVFNQNTKPFSKSLFGFVETNLNGVYNWGKYTDASSSINNASFKGYGANANASIGIGYRVTKYLIADATLSNLLSINYNQSEPDNSSTATTSSKSSGFSVSTGLSSLSLNSVAIGFRWVFQ